VDIGTRARSRRLIELLGIPRRLLPGILPAEVQGLTGIERCPLLTVAEHDTASAMFVADRLHPESAVLSTGTWSILGALLDGPLVSQQAMECGFYNEIACGSVLLAKNLMGFYLLEELVRSWRAKGVYCDYASLEVLARRAPPGGFRLDPNDPLFYSPANVEQVLREYCWKT